jgi:hypothetical protein
MTDFEKGRKDLICNFAQREESNNSKLISRVVSNGDSKKTKMLLRNIRMGEDRNENNDNN